MVSVKNVRAGDCNMLAHIWYGNVVRVVLAGGYRVCLGRRIYTDYLDHEVAVLILVVGAVREVAVSLVQVQSYVKIAVIFLEYPVYCSRSISTRFDNLESVGMIDVATNGCRITAARG